MGPKYIRGARVKIKIRDYLGRVLDPNLTQYENMEGEILESANIVGFISDPWATIGETGRRITIYHYTVKISETIILYDVSEECLELPKALA